MEVDVTSDKVHFQLYATRPPFPIGGEVRKLCVPPFPCGLPFDDGDAIWNGYCCQ